MIGTLLDSNEAHAKAFHEAATKLGHTEMEYEDVTFFSPSILFLAFLSLSYSL